MFFLPTRERESGIFYAPSTIWCQCKLGRGGGAGGGSIKSCFSRGGKTPKDSNESDCVAKTN